jgi:TatD DNase family protein
MLVDVHCHLDHPGFERDLVVVLERARKKGVAAVITSGINGKTNRKSLELAAHYDIVRASLGFYPGEQGSTEEEAGFIRRHAKDIVAVGEVGLDGSEGGELEKQRKRFRAMIMLAEELGKPIIVHSRKAEEEVLRMLAGDARVVLHCFGGGRGLIREAAQRGYYFSIPPNIVRSSHFQSMVREVDINQILTETDAPFLGPRRSERNEPMNVAAAVEKIAEIKGMTREEAEENIFMNYQRMFM